MRFDSVLVTGGSGRLGRHVVDALAGQCAVTVLDCARGPRSEPEHVVDVLDLAALGTAMPGHDAVIHLAAIDSSVTAPPEAVFDTNVRGTWNVLHAAQLAGVRRVIVCSSVAATGLDYTNPGLAPLYLPVDEAHPLRPTQAYGLSKQLDELIAQSFGSRGPMGVVCLRPSWVMFPEAVRRVVARQRDDETAPPASDPPAVGSRHREPLPILRSYVAPEDAARAFRLALELEGQPHGVFLITALDTFEPGPTLPYLERAYGALPEIRKPEIYAADPRASAFDVTRAREVLGWSPSRRWADLAASAAETP